MCSNVRGLCNLNGTNRTTSESGACFVMMEVVPRVNSTRGVKLLIVAAFPLCTRPQLVPRNTHVHVGINLYLGQFRPKKVRLALCAGQSALKVVTALMMLPLLHRRDDTLPNQARTGQDIPGNVRKQLRYDLRTSQLSVCRQTSSAFLLPVEHVPAVREGTSSRNKAPFTSCSAPPPKRMLTHRQGQGNSGPDGSVLQLYPLQASASRVLYPVFARTLAWW